MVATTDSRFSVNPVEREATGTLDRMRSFFDRGEFFTSPDSTASLLRERLATLVSLPKTPTVFPKFRDLVLAFEADWTLLAECRSEWMRLLQSVIRIDPKTGDDNKKTSHGAERAAGNWRSELLAGLAWPLSISSALDAQLSSLPPSESQRILAENLREAVKIMAEHMSFQLDTLVDRCVLGKIEWYGEKACQYSFVERGLQSPIYGIISVGNGEIDIAKRVIRSTAVANIAATKTVSVHVHDLVDAVCSPVSLAMSEIPVQARQVIDSVPKFMQGDLRIVEGNLIRERCIQQEQGVAEWTETWTVVEDLPISFLFDPAIVLASRYVLIGWVNAEPEDTVKPDRAKSLLMSAIDHFFK